MKSLILALALLLTPLSAHAEEPSQISSSASLLTMINVWTPAEGTQQAFVAQLENALTSELVHQQGFISGNIHRSLDSEHVVMYAQWADQAALETFIKKLQSGKVPLMASSFAAATPDYHPYTVTLTAQGKRQ